MYKFFITLLASLLFLCMPSLADFPDKNVVYQITFAAGGGSDVRARHQQPHLEKELGKKIVIQYKPGAGGSIGWANLVKQKADGYFMSGINIPHIILQHWLESLAMRQKKSYPLLYFNKSLLD